MRYHVMGYWVDIFGKVTWLPSFQKIPAVQGCHHTVKSHKIRTIKKKKKKKKKIKKNMDNKTIYTK